MILDSHEFYFEIYFKVKLKKPIIGIVGGVLLVALTVLIFTLPTKSSEPGRIENDQPIDTLFILRIGKESTFYMLLNAIIMVRLKPYHRQM